MFEIFLKRKRFLFLGGVFVLFQGVLGCIPYDFQPEPSKKPSLNQRYKYDTIIRDSTGRYRADGVLLSGDTRVYFYSFRGTALAAINTDQRVAIREIIETRGGGPVDCSKGFHIIDIGRNEGGGVYAKIECNN